MKTQRRASSSVLISATSFNGSSILVIVGNNVVDVVDVVGLDVVVSVVVVIGHMKVTSVVVVLVGRVVVVTVGVVVPVPKQIDN